MINVDTRVWLSCSLCSQAWALHWCLVQCGGLVTLRLDCSRTRRSRPCHLHPLFPGKKDRRVSSTAAVWLHGPSEDCKAEDGQIAWSFLDLLLCGKFFCIFPHCSRGSLGAHPGMAAHCWRWGVGTGQMIVLGVAGGGLGEQQRSRCICPPEVLSSDWDWRAEQLPSFSSQQPKTCFIYSQFMILTESQYPP